MELKEAMLKRRSVRKFTAQPVTEDLIKEMLHAAMSGPSACNKRPWDFYAVTNEAVLEGLRKTSHFSNFKAPLAIVVCGNLDRALPGDSAPFWIQDCSAAIQNILLRVVDLGLGAVWCGVHPVKRSVSVVKEVLNLGEHRIPLGLLHIGWPAEEHEARDQYEEEAVHYIR